jgi:hypothetical protein
LLEDFMVELALWIFYVLGLVVSAAFSFLFWIYSPTLDDRRNFHEEDCDYDVPTPLEVPPPGWKYFTYPLVWPMVLLWGLAVILLDSRKMHRKSAAI